MKKKYDSLIFDLDGTLWYACTPSAKGWNQTFDHYGIDVQVNAKHIESVAGNPFHKCVEALLPDLDLSVYSDFVEKLGSYEKEHMEKEGGILYPYVKEGLKKLSQDYKLFIVSNCSDWYLEMFLSDLEVKQYFSDWDCFGLSLISKSDMIKAMIKKHGLKKPVYIGDTVGDEKAASEALVPFFHAGYGYGKPLGSPRSFATFTDLVSAFCTDFSNLKENK